jgi:SH3-like domain-containing protein
LSPDVDISGILAAMGIRSLVLLCFASLLLVALSMPQIGGKAALAADKPNSTQQRKGSGLPIPRFASLRSDEVNVRTGPGTRYPVDWVFKRKSMPVEIVAEYENWRKIRDWQGASGWVHQSLLTGKRSFIISSKAASLHKTPAASAEVVARLEPEVMGEIRSCAGDWCRVKVSGVSGWIERTGMWGVYKSEPIN